MTELIFSEAQGKPKRLAIQKKVTVAGGDPAHDLRLAGTSGVLFTLVIDEEGRTQLMPGKHKLKVNGFSVHKTIRLSTCDRIEWPAGSAVFLEGLKASDSVENQPAAQKSLAILQSLAGSLQNPGSVSQGLHQLLESLVQMAGAESGSLLSELDGTGWQLVASTEVEAVAHPGRRRRELFSNTILQDSMKRREPVCVENIIGHPWAEAASVIEARIFSAACLPLVISDRVLGAVFLVSRSPGKSIRKEILPELGLLATQAALLLGLQTEVREARKENERLRSLVRDNKPDQGGMIYGGEASPMAELSRKIERLAPTLLSVILTGETGTGKEVVARELHRRSARARGPFVAINCGAIPAALMESTLFGHEKGAFTGAVRAQAGKFSLADGGTLFLDEIGDLPLELQAKLLRVLQEKAVETVGGDKPVPVDVRIIAATHQDLGTAIKAGRFRDDLYFRLSGATVRLPALRERGGDVFVLAEHFIRATGVAAVLSEEAKRALQAHAWPGNVRELEQTITRAALLCTGCTISAQDLELSIVTRPEAADVPASLNEAQEAFTQGFVRQALLRRGGNRTETATALGISERTLYRILAETDNPGRPD